MVDYKLQSKTNAPFLTPKLRVTQRNIMVLHSFVGSSPEPIYAILPTSVYYTPYSFIPYALLLYTTRPTPYIPYVLLLYTTRPTHLYYTPHPFILYALPLYTKKIINKAAKAQ